MVHLEADSDRLHLHAELGGVDSMTRFLYRFPLGMGIGVGLFIGVTAMIAGQGFGMATGFPDGLQGWHVILAGLVLSLLPVSPWIVLSPMMSRMILRRTQRALEMLLHNAKHQVAYGS